MGGLPASTTTPLTPYQGSGFRVVRMTGLTIGQLAQRAGMAVGTIRYYERQGLIAEPPRRASGYRQYPVEAQRRLRFIRRAKKLGFSLREIAELLSLRTSSQPCGEIREQIAGKISDLDLRVRELRRMKRALEELSRLCEESSPTDECPFLDLLEEES
jgi:MerR family copper efflux transcriptional regulator